MTSRDEHTGYAIEVDSIVAARAKDDGSRMHTDEDIANLSVGDLVKVIFTNPNDHLGGERMWVQIASIEGDQVVGLLKNVPTLNLGLDFDDVVTFPARAVVDINTLS